MCRILYVAKTVGIGCTTSTAVKEIRVPSRGMRLTGVLMGREMMSRYIDADEMLEYLDLMYEHQDDKDEPYNIGILGAINYIKHRAKAIDIVRCRECVSGTPSGIFCGEADMYICNANDQDLYEAEHFCSYGERREP